MLSDTVADMLTRIRNANLVRHKIVMIPSTTITRSIALILVNEGLIHSFEDGKDKLNSFLILFLKYNKRKPCIEELQRISRSGLRVYSGIKKMPRILGGFGIAIVSTSKGLMTDQQAKKEGLGGELLCYIE